MIIFILINGGNMKKIEGSPKNLKQLLQNTKYSIHYYQREYMWQRKHIEELINDLTSEFLEYYEPEHERKDVENYGAYFMGSVVLAGHENAIIDGQQRFTSLTLLLIYLNNKLKNIGHNYPMIEQMIYSESYGTAAFNINVEDRQKCMEAIFNEQDFDITNEIESVKNLYGRYEDIQELFPINEIKDNALLNFCDWLAEKVFFIEIVATTEQDAHKIFVTMNDRGLSLTSTEMLKGYLLSEIADDKKRESLNTTWKSEILKLKEFDEKDGDETFIRAWLRAQYAETIRETKAGAINKDFDIIGGPFHKWVRDEKQKLNLNSSDDFEKFIEDFSYFAQIYRKIKDAETSYNEKYKYIYYNAQVNFTLQTQLLLAPICRNDDTTIIDEKLNLVSRFIDLLIIARVCNYKSVDYSTIKNYLFNITKDIRHLSVPDLKVHLKKHYSDLLFDVDSAIKDFALNGFTKKYIKHILSRITAYIEEQIGVANNYCNYMDTKTKNPFEIEHIITNHHEWFLEEYPDIADFNRWRNNIGALLLLHKSINASLNDKLYSHKINKYCSNEGNIYTESLGELAYKNNPRFLRFKNEYNLNFEAYSEFGKNEILQRNKLVAQLVKLIWNDELFN
jgi:hypothetical protein